MKYYKTIYIVRYINAYGYIETKMVQKSTLDRYIKNWGWEYNGDKSGLEVINIYLKQYLSQKLRRNRKMKSTNSLARKNS